MGHADRPRHGLRPLGPGRARLPGPLVPPARARARHGHRGRRGRAVVVHGGPRPRQRAGRPGPVVKPGPRLTAASAAGLRRPRGPDRGRRGPAPLRFQARAHPARASLWRPSRRPFEPPASPSRCSCSRSPRPPWGRPCRYSSPSPVPFGRSAASAAGLLYAAEHGGSSRRSAHHPAPAPALPRQHARGLRRGRRQRGRRAPRTHPARAPERQPDHGRTRS